MIKKYNLALLPATKNAEIIKYSQTLSGLADTYMLGVDSLPHVTLYQFEIDETEINLLWAKVNQSWTEAPLEITFNRLSCLTFNQIIYWVLLMPTNAITLYEMHAKIANIIHRPIKKNYDPHMTLINTKNKNCELEIKKLLSPYQPMRDVFTLSLGRCDAVGQFNRWI